jgi:predicted DCC family thiol-disulfide oxidoreductase YuxK
MGQSTLLYDADCGFCRWSLVRVLRWDRRNAVRPLALQNPEADELLADLDEDRRLASWHLVTADGRVYSGGDAVAPLADLLPGGAPVATLARVFPATTRRLYDWVRRHRDGLGRRVGADACMAGDEVQKQPRS